MTHKSTLLKLLRTGQAGQEALSAISCLSITELRTERMYQMNLIRDLTTDIVFHEDSIKLFGRLKADYLFINASTRKQLNKIIAYHQGEIKKIQGQISYNHRVITRIDTPVVTPDGVSKSKCPT